MKRMVALLLLLGTIAVSAGFAEAKTFSYTLISKMNETNPRVVAIAIDFEKVLALNWELDTAFQVQAELFPVKAYSGDLIANSAAAKASRTIKRAYTSAKPELGNPGYGKYVIVEMDPYDYNGSAWYCGFNPDIRQYADYGDNLAYSVKLLQEINYLVPNVGTGPLAKPGSIVDTVKTDSTFRLTDRKVLYVDDYIQALYTDESNNAVKALGYNFYQPSGLPADAKVPLVVFLHGSGSSHDYRYFPNDLMRDVKSPLVTFQAGTSFIEMAGEKTFVLVPQMPARDLKDAKGESGWSHADIYKLLLGLVDKLIAENPAIDTNRLYITGLSMGGIGIWKIITDPNPAIASKFAAAVIDCGTPAYSVPSVDSAVAYNAKVVEALSALNYDTVKVPVWFFHADTDPLVSILAPRVAFAKLTGKATVAITGELKPFSSITKSDNGLVRYYASVGETSGKDVRFTEYQFGDGSRFRDLGMLTPAAHCSWEAVYKTQAMFDWMFSQKK